MILVIVAATGAAPRRWRAGLSERWREPRFRFMATLALAPLALTLVAGLALRTKISTNMTIGVFSLVPLVLIEIVAPEAPARLVRYAWRTAALLSAAALVASPAIAYGRLRWSSDPNDLQPRRELAHEAARIWHAATSAPLLYVAGTDLYENAAAFYSPDRPHAFLHFDHYRAPWITPEDLARHGLLSVCVKDDEPCRAATAALARPDATSREVTLAHRFWGRSAPAITFVVTVIPPAG